MIKASIKRQASWKIGSPVLLGGYISIMETTPSQYRPAAMVMVNGTRLYSSWYPRPNGLAALTDRICYSNSSSFLSIVFIKNLHQISSFTFKQRLSDKCHPVSRTYVTIKSPPIDFSASYRMIKPVISAPFREGTSSIGFNIIFFNYARR